MPGNDTPTMTDHPDVLDLWAEDRSDELALSCCNGSFGTVGCASTAACIGTSLSSSASVASIGTAGCRC
jgi:hypothetical protein